MNFTQVMKIRGADPTALVLYRLTLRPLPEDFKLFKYSLILSDD